MQPNIYAIIPARSGSKGLPDKNIKQIGSKSLIGHSISFAKKLDFVNKIICSTDSELYARIAIENGAEVPFLRSKESSSSNAMEDEILKDLRKKFIEFSIPEPDIIVWLRPTFIFRSISDVNYCINKLINNSDLTAARIIVSSENRLYNLNDKNLLISTFNDNGKSMIRRQDMMPSYKVYNTDVFRFKNNKLNENFLGKKIFGKISNSLCGLDIDNLEDFHLVKTIYENKLYNKEILL